tara:strand:+ start:246 stop:680 length:435 start_codon:yes stop_codon:yes gene_type:complete
MDKDFKIIIITEEIKKRKLIETHHGCYKKKTFLKEMTQQILKATEIVIYDITETNQRKKKIYINDHISKTGESPLRKMKPLEFIDISDLYKKEKGGIITTSLGKNFKKEKKNYCYPSTFISSIAILCKKINPTITIQGRLINCL